MKKPFILLLCLALLVPAASPGWGFFAHRTIAQIAVYALPDGLQPFYFRHLKEIVRLSTAADERRDADPKEATKHFIDMDHYGDDPFGLMPKAWDKAEAKYTADTLRKYGTVPWEILEVKDQLTAAFKARDTAAIVRLSADLSHYVADTHVPLHTTVNYDGQLSNQEGLHALWESKLPERHISEYKLDSESARFLKDPLTDIWKVVRESYGFLGATFDLEEKVTRKFTPETKYVFSHKYGKTRRSYSDAFADAYHKEVGGMVAFRLKQAPTLVASLWLTAWRNAGSPNLTEMLAKKPGKEEKELLSSQLKPWKDNGLVAQQQLLALEKQQAAVQADLINSAVELPAPVLETASPVVPAAAVPGAPTPQGAEKVKVKAKTTESSTKQKDKKKPDPRKNDGWDTPAGSGW